MNCNKLLKEAFEGINFSYKLDDVIAEMPSTVKFGADTIEAYLKKKGVSPLEMKASGILDMYKGDYKFTAAEWQEDFAKLGNKHHLTDIDVTEGGKAEDYARVTLGQEGLRSPTYKETMTQVPRQPGHPKGLRHYSEYETGMKTNLGWRRVHTSPNVNGRSATVLNETQSDYAQFERDGYGRFSSSTDEAILERISQIDGDIQEMYGKTVAELYTTKDVEWLKKQPLLRKRTQVGLLEGEDRVIADFPMNEKKFHKLNIVKAIDQAVQNGTNRVVIPIEREAGLVGTENVTKFYENLGSSLKDIKKNLREAYDIDISKESYSSYEFKSDLINYGDGSYYDKEADLLNGLELAKSKKEAKKVFDEFTEERLSMNYSVEFMNSFDKALRESPESTSVWNVEIKPIEGAKAQYNYYGLLGAVGLGGLADKMREAESQ